MNREELQYLPTVPVDGNHRTDGSLRPVAEKQVQPGQERPAEKLSAKRPGKITALTRLAVFSTVVGAGVTTIFLGYNRKQAEQPVQIASAQTPDVDSISETEYDVAVTTEEDLAKELDRYNMHPTDADFSKPRMVHIKGKTELVPYVEKNQYFEALKLILPDIPPGTEVAPDNAGGEVGVPYEWAKMSYDTFNSFSDRYTLVAINVKDAARMGDIKFSGFYRPTIVLKHAERQTIYALYDSCTITPEAENKKLTKETSTRLIERQKKTGGVASFAFVEGGVNQRICPIKIPPCKDEAQADVGAATGQ